MPSLLDPILAGLALVAIAAALPACEFCGYSEELERLATCDFRDWFESDNSTNYPAYSGH